MSIQQQLNQLNEQQSAITAALLAMEEGRWLATEYGANSVEANLIALNPTFSLAPRKPKYVDTIERFNPLWVGSPNHYNGRQGAPVVAIVIHTMAGSLESTDNWFSNPNSMVSSHYGIGLDGTVHQYVNLQDGSWANGILEDGNKWYKIVGNVRNPNYQTVTIETEDLGLGSTPVTDAQYQATFSACRYAIKTFPGIRWLFGHRVISPRTRPNCCGNRWWAARFDELANALRLEAVK